MLLDSLQQWWQNEPGNLLPYCHPIPIDSINVDVSVNEQSIEVTVTVKNVAKTGVEMEALTGACIAALTIYDMLKPVEKR